MARTICHSFLATCAQRPSSDAVRHRVNMEAGPLKPGTQWTTVSWAEYLKAVERTAAAFSASGLGAGDRVVIWSSTRWEWAVADLAILGLGAATVPIYPNSPVADVEFILNHSGAVALIVENDEMFEKWVSVRDACPRVRTVFRMTEWRALQVSGAERLSRDPELLQRAIATLAPSDLATIVYTSGTTGRPRGVVLTHAQVTTGVGSRVALSPSDTSLTLLPFAHIAGRLEHWAHVHIGFCMGYAESLERIRENFLDVRPTFVAGVPRLFEKIYEAVLTQVERSAIRRRVFRWAVGVGHAVSDARMHKRPLSFAVRVKYRIASRIAFERLRRRLGGRLRFAISGGAPLRADIARFFHAAGILILEVYGLTETTAAVVRNSLADYRFGTVGKAFGDVQIRIAVDGEILVKSQQVMQGYLDDEAATREAISADGWFSTGDIGEMSDDGFLTITDRKKDLIKTAGGKYVAPQKLEHLLKASKFVANVLLHGDGRKCIVALIAPDFAEVRKFADANGIPHGDQEALVHDEQVRGLFRQAVEQANAQLPGYEAIKNFDVLSRDFTIEAGELTPSMKVRRGVCSRKYAAAIDRLYVA